LAQSGHSTIEFRCPLSGVNQGRLIFDHVIVTHESAEAMKFGRRKLKDIADACGVKDSITDLTVLLNKARRRQPASWSRSSRARKPLRLYQRLAARPTPN
jgi:hypothetical protein